MKSEKPVWVLMLLDSGMFVHQNATASMRNSNEQFANTFHYDVRVWGVGFFVHFFMGLQKRFSGKVGHLECNSGVDRKFCRNAAQVV
jgi:hypothetical protein